MQHTILSKGLKAASVITSPGTIIDLELAWKDDFWKAEPLSWSRARQEQFDADPGGLAPAGDTRSKRSDKPQYQSAADAAAAAD